MHITNMYCVFKMWAHYHSTYFLLLLLGTTLEHPIPHTGATISLSILTQTFPHPHRLATTHFIPTTADLWSTRPHPPGQHRCPRDRAAGPF